MLSLLRAAPVACPAPGPEDWYANLLWFDGRKCLLLTHAGTLFSVFEPDVRAAGLRDTRHAVAALISRELARENLPAGNAAGGDERQVVAAGGALVANQYHGDGPGME